MSGQPKSDVKSDDKATKQSDCGLTFGPARRRLFWVLECEILSYLVLEDLTSIFYVSRLMCSQIIRFLRVAKALHFDMEVLRMPLLPHSELAINLAAKHCRGLREIRIADNRSQWVAFYQEHLHSLRHPSWLLRMVTNNRDSLRDIRVPTGIWEQLPAAFSAALACPAIEHLHLADLSEFASEDICNLRTSGQLRSLEAAVDMRTYATVKIAQLEEILSKERHLTELKLSCGHSPEPLLKFLRFTDLHVLSLKIPHEPFNKQFLLSMSEALISLVHLRELDLLAEATTDDSGVSDIVWHCPALRTLVFYCTYSYSWREKQRPPLPTVKAPNLQSLTLQGTYDETVETMMELCKTAPGLTTIELSTWKDIEHSKFFTEFRQLLATGFWPQLKTLTFFPSSLSDVVSVLLEHPRPELRSLNVGVQSNAQARALLLAHPALESIKLQLNHDSKSFKGDVESDSKDKENEGKEKEKAKEGEKCESFIKMLNLGALGDTFFILHSSRLMFSALQECDIAGTLSSVNTLFAACPVLTTLRINHLKSKNWRMGPHDKLTTMVLKSNQRNFGPYSSGEALFNFLSAFPNLTNLTLCPETDGNTPAHLFEDFVGQLEAASPPIFTTLRRFCIEGSRVICPSEEFIKRAALAMRSLRYFELYLPFEKSIGVGSRQALKEWAKQTTPMMCMALTDTR